MKSDLQGRGKTGQGWQPQIPPRPEASQSIEHPEELEKACPELAIWSTQQAKKEGRLRNIHAEDCYGFRPAYPLGWNKARTQQKTGVGYDNWLSRKNAGPGELKAMCRNTTLDWSAPTEEHPHAPTILALIEVSGPDETSRGVTTMLEEREEAHIGRSREFTIYLQEPRLSRQHVVLTNTEGSLTIKNSQPGGFLTDIQATTVTETNYKPSDEVHAFPSGSTWKFTKAQKDPTKNYYGEAQSEFHITIHWRQIHREGSAQLQKTVLGLPEVPGPLRRLHAAGGPTGQRMDDHAMGSTTVRQGEENPASTKRTCDLRNIACCTGSPHEARTYNVHLARPRGGLHHLPTTNKLAKVVLQR